MPFTTLISTADLSAHIDDPDWVVVDCRFNLADVTEGQRDYEAGHIAGAVFADLDHDLSGPAEKGKTGRHPLPSAARAAEVFSRLGIDANTQVVAYDDKGGMTAGRLWWMLRWLGHDSVAVLDGGLSHWKSEGGPTTSGIESRAPRTFVPNEVPELMVDAESVDRLRTDPEHVVVDSRAADRYRGENETIDPVAGHIPGAASAPYMENLGADGRFLSPEQLRERFVHVLGDADAQHAVFYCGSGVTAAHNVLAVAHAGLGNARLYPGSWSEWITDAGRPIATGSDRGA
jgi:thiosulfate/3-mercaptopyruvate sulfurtransferase